jgi:NAD-dependent SIR2 family protein deacetylase
MGYEDLVPLVADEPFLHRPRVAVTFVLGAGASAGVGIPLMGDLSRAVYGGGDLTREEKIKLFHEQLGEPIRRAQLLGRPPAVVALAAMLRRQGHRVRIISTNVDGLTAGFPSPGDVLEVHGNLLRGDVKLAGEVLPLSGTAQAWLAGSEHVIVVGVSDFCESVAEWIRTQPPRSAKVTQVNPAAATLRLANPGTREKAQVRWLAASAAEYAAAVAMLAEPPERRMLVMSVFQIARRELGLSEWGPRELRSGRTWTRGKEREKATAPDAEQDSQ